MSAASAIDRAIDDPVVARAVKAIPRAAMLGHSGRAFLDHLLGTWRILRDWRMPEPVCRAGFMHSAYSTSYYPHALFALDQRENVRRMIGGEAEDLAYRFCSMDRRGYWNALAGERGAREWSYPDRLHAPARVAVDRETLTRLLVIESANIAEQSSDSDRGPAPWMSTLFGWWNFLEDREIPVKLGARPALRREDEERAIRAYQLALGATPARAASLLDQSIALNPWAAEPRILRALADPDGEARGHAQAATDLLSAWAVAWDKRLEIGAWRALCERASEPGAGDALDPGFDAVRARVRGEAPTPRGEV